MVNNFPENKGLFKRLRLLPGNTLYATAVSECEVNSRYEEINFSRQQQRKKTFIISDNKLTRIKKDSFRKKIERR